MKEKIEIKSILKYENDKNVGVRIGFYFIKPEMLANNKNFKGYSENACFYGDLSVFDKLPLDIINKQVEVTLKSIPSVKNAMRSISVIDTIYYNGQAIHLLSSEK